MEVNFVAVFAIREVYISGNVLTDSKHFPTLQVSTKPIMMVETVEPPTPQTYVEYQHFVCEAFI